MTAGRQHFATLDALRGVAAIGVMLAHTYGDHIILLPSGYMAVDLFFGLSGFVMALTYQARLRAGMGIGEFMARRAARLWPMLLIGAAIGIAVLDGRLGMLVLIPDVTSSGQLYPANGVLWSLLMEMGAYLVFALVIVRLGLRSLGLLVVASGIALVAYAGQQDVKLIEFGNEWHALPHGIARTAYDFTMGVMIYRLRAAQGLPRRTTHLAWLLPLALCYVMLLVPSTQRAVSLAAMMAVVPAILWWATRWDIPSSRIAKGLSALSYPLYCIHLPLMALGFAWDIPGPALWLPLVGLALALDCWWDRPMRQRLRGMVERLPKAQLPAR